MSWLRSSPLRQNLISRNSSQSSSIINNDIRYLRTIDATTNCDPKACYDSFCIHWQQAYEIILKSDVSMY